MLYSFLIATVLARPVREHHKFALVVEGTHDPSQKPSIPLKQGILLNGRADVDFLIAIQQRSDRDTQVPECN